MPSYTVTLYKQATYIVAVSAADHETALETAENAINETLPDYVDEDGWCIEQFGADGKLIGEWRDDEEWDEEEDEE